MYASLLEQNEIIHTKHSTHFSNLLIENVPELKKSTLSKRLVVYFDTAINELISSEDYFENLVQLIGPVRKAMYLQCQSKNVSLSVDKNSQIASVPTELLTLINFLQDGINLEDKEFSKESLAVSLLIMYNFRYNTKEKGISSYKRHNKCTETPFPLYVAVKIYSTCRSKTLINWLYFTAGIALPYKNLLELTNDIANRMLNQYEKDGVFLPRT